MHVSEWRGFFSRRFAALALIAFALVALAAPVRAAGGVSIQVKDGQPKRLPPGGRTVLGVTITPAVPAVADTLRGCLVTGTDCPIVRVSSGRGKVTPGQLPIEELIISGGGDPNVPLRLEVTFVAGTEAGPATIKAEVMSKGRVVAADSAVIEIEGGEKAEALQISVTCTPGSGGASLACSVKVLNPMKDENFVYHYWVDDQLAETDLALGPRSSQTISDPDLEAGEHVLEVEVLGKDRSKKTKLSFTIREAGDEGDAEPETKPKDSASTKKDGAGESLFEKGELDQIPGWDKQSPEVKRQLQELAAKSRADKAAQDQGSGASGETAGGAPQVEEPEPATEGDKPKAEPAIRPDKVQQELQRMMDDRRTILREYEITLAGEEEYRQQHALGVMGRVWEWVTQTYDEWGGIVSDPEELLIGKFQDIYKEQTLNAAKDLLQREGAISKDPASPVTEAEFARAVYIWAEASSKEVVPIHYQYYRQEYETYLAARRSELPRVLQKGWSPSEKELSLAHDHAIGRVRDRLAGRVEETFEQDLVTRDVGQIGGSGKLGRSWDPKYLQDDERMDAYDEAFPKINAKTSYP